MQSKSFHPVLLDLSDFEFFSSGLLRAFSLSEADVLGEAARVMVTHLGKPTTLPHPLNLILYAISKECEMDTCLAQSGVPISWEAALSLASVTMTAYFWMVQARRERPHLQFFQMQDFRAILRRGNDNPETKRLSVTQVAEGGILIANHSTRQNAIVRFDCFLQEAAGWRKGQWGFMEEERFPWNIPPESAISRRLACFFDVPHDYEVPDQMNIRVEFITVSGQKFSDLFYLKAPEL